MTRIPRPEPEGEAALARDIRIAGLPAPMTQYRFAAEMVGPGKGLRKRLADAGLKDWRTDFAWVDYRLIVEVEGGAFIGKGHTGGKKFTDDCRKYNTLAMAGWTLLRYTTAQVEDATAKDEIELFFRRKHHD